MAWLVQMDQGRGGLYPYEWVENLLGAQIHNLDRINPGLQQLAIGDRIRLTPELTSGGIPGKYDSVAEISPPGVAARLERHVELLLLEPGYFVMERGMTRAIKRRAEAVAAHPAVGRSGAGAALRIAHGELRIRVRDSPVVGVSARA